GPRQQGGGAGGAHPHRGGQTPAPPGGGQPRGGGKGPPGGPPGPGPRPAPAKNRRPGQDPGGQPGCGRAGGAAGARRGGAGPRRTCTGFRASRFAVTSLVYERASDGARGLRRSAHTSAPAIANAKRAMMYGSNVCGWNLPRGSPIVTRSPAASGPARYAANR